MKIALCTISFRHQLISIKELIAFASANGFDGIELWGAHARNLYETSEAYPWSEDPRAMLAQSGLEISMITDYLNIAADVPLPQIEEQTKRIIALADWFGVSRIRTFAGERPSAAVSLQQRAQYVERLRRIGDICAAHGKKLLLETHTNTLADCLDSTQRLMEELAHPVIGLNLDFFHLWESGTAPMTALNRLNPWVHYYHLKNISSLLQAKLFEPQNVYAPSGDRSGMVSLSRGAIDYRPVLDQMQHSPAFNQTERFASLEWFGANPAEVLAKDIQFIRNVHAAQSIG